MSRLCNWRLPRDSRIGRLPCVRPIGHSGRHWVFTQSEGSLLVYEVWSDERGLKLVLSASTLDQLSREEVSLLVEYVELQRYHGGG
jgi:hypothetical protein